MNQENIYYHYTSIEALYNIIDKKKLWLSNLKDTNDPKELTFKETDYTNLLSEILKNNDNIQNLVENINDKDLKSDLTEILLNLDVINPPTLLGKNAIIINNSVKFCDYYSLSMTKLRDSQLHWLQYGNNFKGVCIGINTDIIDKFFSNDSTISYDNIIYTNDYKNDDIVKLIIQKLNSIFIKDNFLDFYNHYKDNKELFIENGLLFVFKDVYKLITPLIKKQYFKDEKETRIVFQLDYRKTYNKKFEIYYYIDNDYISKPKQVISNGKIKDIIEVDIEKLLSNGLIKEIILGTKCEQNHSILQNFLYNNGVSEIYSITKSEFIIN